MAEKTKARIGDNFVSDSYYKNDPAKKYLKYAAHYSVIRKISPNGMPHLRNSFWKELASRTGVEPVSPP